MVKYVLESDEKIEPTVMVKLEPLGKNIVLRVGQWCVASLTPAGTLVLHSGIPENSSVNYGLQIVDGYILTEFS